MSINIPKIIVTLVNLGILVWFVKRIAFDKVNAIIKARKERIEDTIAKADDDLEKARVLKIKNEREITTSKKKGKEIVDEYKVKADELKNDILSEAKEEADRLLEKSRAEIEREKEKAECEMRDNILNISMLISEKALGESISEEKHKELIDDYISKVGM